MKPKLLFWIDQALFHYGLAKYIQENLDCEMYSIFEVTENAKKFFKKQKIVNFEKTWFFHDNILKQKKNFDLKYLQDIERKYNLDLQLIAFNDRIFYKFNSYYKFSRNEILCILEEEIRFFESVLDEIKPEFLIIFETHQQHNHIFYEICKARGIEVIIPVGSRIGINPKSSLKHGNRWYLSDDIDQCLPLPDKIENNDSDQEIVSNNSFTDEKFSYEFQKSNKKYLRAALRYFFTKENNLDTHYSYFGRSKIKVILKMIHYELRKKYRENFMEKNLNYEIDEKLNLVYFPLHQEEERILLIGAPYYTNQFELIRNISNSLPAGYILAVKDHTVMNVRGWRGIKEIKQFMELPNVIMFHHSVDSTELIKKSKLVMSIRGTTAIEAAFYKKPSIAFGKVGMYKISTMTIVDSIKDLTKIIRNSLTQKINEDEIKRYEKTVYNNTFEFPMYQIGNAFEDEFKIGGYYANVEIESDKMQKFLEKYKEELTFLALKHVEKIKNYK
tara:strand:+ start:815 stop:2317 length:1503 start_codon:yes stop_codon:yes gene_type:complete